MREYDPNPRSMVLYHHCIDVDLKTHCWIWKGKTDTIPYTTDPRTKKAILVHKLLWRLDGNLPAQEGEWLSRNEHCPTKCCVNPWHREITEAYKAAHNWEGRKARKQAIST